MQRTTTFAAAILLAALFAVAAVSGEVFVMHGGADGFDLSGLAEGESRTFGEGDKRVTATRAGDIVTIERDRSGAEPFDCNLATDTCTIAADGAQVKLAIAREIVCEGGAGDCADVEVIGGKLHDLSGLHNVWVSEDCEGPECEKKVEVIVGGAVGDAGENVFIVDGGGVHTRHSGATLRCPEGDATLHVDAEEADDTFLCPKHSLAMEKAAPHFIHKKVRVVRGED